MLIIMILFGLVFAGIGVFIWIKQRKLKQACTSQTNAVVSGIHHEVQESTDSEGRRRRTSYYYPEFTYTAGGAVYVERSSVGSIRARFSEGQTVNLFFNPADPKQYIVGEDKTAAFAGPVFAISGVAITVIGIVLLLK